MTTSDTRPVTAASRTAPPIEAWLTPIAIATLASGFVSCLGQPIMYMSYYMHRWGTMPNTQDGPMRLTSYFGVRPFLFCLAWSLLFALCYRELTVLRRVTDTLLGLIGVAILYGTLAWALIHFVIFPSKLGEAPYSVLFWLRYVLFIGPPIVWAIRRFSPLVPSRPIFERKPPSPVSGRREIIIGVVAAIPAVLCLVWLKTDPSASYLMILAFFIAVGAVGILAIAAGLILGGIWAWFGLPGRLLMQLSPLLVLIVGALFVFYRPPV